MDMFAQNLVLYSDRTNTVSWNFWGTNIDDAMVGAFAHAVATGTPVPVTGVDGLRAAEVAFAAYRSAEQNTPIAL
jgi:predicted dehydrogenase